MIGLEWGWTGKDPSTPRGALLLTLFDSEEAFEYGCFDEVLQELATRLCTYGCGYADSTIESKRRA